MLESIVNNPTYGIKSFDIESNVFSGTLEGRNITLLDDLASYKLLGFRIALIVGLCILLPSFVTALCLSARKWRRLDDDAQTNDATQVAANAAPKIPPNLEAEAKYILQTTPKRCNFLPSKM